MPIAPISPSVHRNTGVVPPWLQEGLAPTTTTHAQRLTGIPVLPRTTATGAVAPTRLQPTEFDPAPARTSLPFDPLSRALLNWR